MNVRTIALAFLISLFSGSPLFAYKIVCVGSVCLDTTLQVDDAMLQEMTLKKGDTHRVDYEKFKKILNASSVQQKNSMGGSATNVARALAYIGQECALVGKVGKAEAPTILKDLKEARVIPFLRESSTPTTRVCCLVTPDGQRTMPCFLGASSERLDTTSDLASFAHAEVVDLDGYLLFNGEGYVESLAQKAKEQGAKIVSLVCGSCGVVNLYKDVIVQLLRSKKVDIIFANEDEIRALTGLNSEQGCKELQKLCTIVVATAGKNGCFVTDSSGVIHSPAFTAQVVDTTGAGDFFRAGFLYAYVHGKDIKTCAQYGNLLGKSVVEVFGTSLSSDQWQHLRKDLAKLEK